MEAGQPWNVDQDEGEDQDQEIFGTVGARTGGTDNDRAVFDFAYVAG